MAPDTTSKAGKSRKALLGKKLGMTQIFTEGGQWIPVTVLQAGPCAVLQVKTEKTESYSAVQIGFQDRRKSAVQPQRAFFEKIGVPQKRFLREVSFVDPADVVQKSSTSTGDGGVSPGDVIGVGVFKGISRVDVRGVTKGRGFAGVIKRHNFNSGPKAHGSKNVREPGSTGMHTDPGRVIKGKRMPGHLGAVNRKARNLSIVKLDEEQNLLLVKGAVPGPNGGFVYIEESLRQGT